MRVGESLFFCEGEGVNIEMKMVLQYQHFKVRT